MPACSKSGTTLFPQRKNVLLPERTFDVDGPSNSRPKVTNQLLPERKYTIDESKKGTSQESTTSKQFLESKKTILRNGETYNAPGNIKNEHSQVYFRKYKIPLPTPEIRIITNRNGPIGGFSQSGNVRIIPVGVERRLVSNPIHNFNNPVNVRTSDQARPSRIGPIILTRQDHTRSQSTRPDFVKPQFNFIISNMSTSSGGEFQIKPIVRTAGPRNIWVQVNRERSFHDPSYRHDNIFPSTRISFPQSNAGADVAYLRENIHNVPKSITAIKRLKRSIEDEDPADIQGSSLTFVFDTTGSMASELRQVQQQASKIAAAMTNHPDKPIYDYVFVPFNDPG